MVTEDYVSFETAKLLKEKGFKGIGSYFYEKEDILVDFNNYWRNLTPLEKYDAIEAPTLQMAMKWLREVYEECVVVQPIITDDDGSAGCLWQFSISKLLKIQYNSECVYERYETACEAAIKYCLKNLI